MSATHDNSQGAASMSIAHRIVWFIVLSTAWSVPAFAQAEKQDWPCFLSRDDAARFTKGLEGDLAASRQRLVDKFLKDVGDSADSCPAAARVLADFRRDLTTLFEATFSKEIVIERLRPRWTKSWGAAQCQEVAALTASASAKATDAAAAGAVAAEPASFPEVLERWSTSTSVGASPLMRDKRIAERVKETLTGIKTDLGAVQREANATLGRALPPIVRRDRDAAMKAVDVCIAEEEARLRRTPDAPATTPPSRAESTPAASLPYGLSIDPPSPFIVSRGDPGQKVLLKVTSPAGKPPAVNVDGSLCGVGFGEAPQNAPFSQDAINEIVSGQEWRDRVLTSLRVMFDMDPGEPVDCLGIRGLEFIGTAKSGPRAADVRMYMVMLETPKGRTTFTCATTEKALPSALPVFRSILNTLHPAR
jgi:hypothetical protein